MKKISTNKTFGVDSPPIVWNFNLLHNAANREPDTTNMSTPAQDPNVIVLSGRCSFPALDKPKQFKSKPGESPKPPKFGLSVLFDKKAGAGEIKRLRDLIARLAAEKWKDKIITIKGAPEGDILVDQPNNPKAGYLVLAGTCLRNGMEKVDKDGYGPGVMFIASSRSVDKGPPRVCDKTKLPINAASENYPYAGCYVKASFRLWCQDDAENGKRVNAELRAVIFDKHGEPFGAAPVDVDSDFAGVDLDADEETAPAAKPTPKSAPKAIDIDDM